MGSNRAFATICLLLCVILSTNFLTHCVVDARKSVGFERQPKKVMIKALKHTSLLEKMMTQLNLAQPLDYSSSSNTQPYGVSTTLTLPPDVSLPPLSVPGNAPPFCVNPPLTPPSTSYPGLSPPPGPITLPNPPDSSSNPNSNPNPPESSSNPNPPDSSSNPNSNPNPPESSSNPNPPDSSSNPNPPVTVPNPPESSSNPNPPESSSNPNPPITIPNPPETVPSPPESGYTPGPILGPPYSEPGPSTPTGSIPSPSSGFLPPIVYPPPMAPPSPSVTPTSAYWCVAKPSVPDPIIQEAMNFACGSGADCHSIQPNGPCFKPNTLWAHASFAFNSYWQRTKGTGGSCTFGGTGMLVTVDPSFNGCHFDFF
ncbi:X8 domain [Arabidopsis suecica]|uniref:X8 domain n=1 Tax=Arabidopsis suecica TaxID=45249 RepID=A0A8T2BTD5_ARASU|nr:X8 domain [Arabidopsis suecica]